MAKMCDVEYGPAVLAPREASRLNGSWVGICYGGCSGGFALARGEPGRTRLQPKKSRLAVKPIGMDKIFECVISKLGMDSRFIIGTW
jgi:hypothetical protein